MCNRSPQYMGQEIAWPWGRSGVVLLLRLLSLVPSCRLQAVISRVVPDGFG